MQLPANTTFASSPAIKEGGGYAYGMELNYCKMSINGVGEDGFIISESAAKKGQFRIYEK